MAKSLGINVVTNPTYVRYFEKTNRVSVHWVGRINVVDEAEKWTRMNHTNDVVKRKIVDEWLKNRDSR